MKKIGINDIAIKAGVSKTTVSFAFNNPERLPEQTVERILKTAEELGYSPDPIARSMSTGHTGTIGVLIPQSIPDVIRNPFIPEFLEGIGEICTREGLSLMIVPPLKGSMKRAIENAAVDGFITLGLEEYKATMIVLRQRGVPFVTVDSDPIEGIPAVNIDDESGARAAMTYMLQQGHRNIAILAIRSGKEGHYEEYHGTLHFRMSGYLQALADFGLTLDKSHVRLVEGICTEEGGQESFHSIWKWRQRPTAIVAMSDIMAIGVLNAAREAGVSTHELSVIGFDDIPMSSFVNPALTTVSQPRCTKGRLAAEMLLNYINGQIEPIHHILPTELVLRKSVLPAPIK
jgi:Transcriptional regulators